MNFFCVSLPGRFGDWCDIAIARLASSVLGPVVSIGGSTAEDLATQLINTEASHFYIGARHPRVWLCDKLTAAGKKFIIALEDPRQVVRDLVVVHQIGILEATRHVASVCGSISRYLPQSGALVVRAGRDWSNPAETLLSFADHLGLAVDAVQIAAIAADLDAAGLRPADGPADPEDFQLATDERELVEGAVGPYADYFTGYPLGPVRWGRELFLDDHHQPAAHPIEISGRVRDLIYGPYIALPPGGWTAEMVLGFSDDATDTSFLIQAWAGAQLASATMQPQRAGVFLANISFTIEPGNDTPLDIRVVNERAALFGRLALGHVSLTPRQGAPQSMTESLRLELGLDEPGQTAAAPI